ncbi:MAG TPA: ATP-binding protein [Chloroflexota bacterium]|nr:ATP-binding protein [Chloroflexota bacterium]
MTDDSDLRTGRQPTLLLLIGPPGTGKSTIARRIRAATGADIVQTDALRKVLVAQPTYRPSESAWIHRVAQQRLRQKLSRGHDVIFDATNLRKVHRKVLQNLADMVGARMLALVVWAPESVIRQRLLHRQEVPDLTDKSDANWAVYQHLIASFEPLDGPHIMINSTVDFSLALRQIEALLNSSSASQ